MKHFSTKYGDAHDLPPYWMMVEAATIGTLESLYSHMPPSVKSEIASVFNVRVPVLKNWLSVIRVARNACCHHSRVWNRIWGVQPAIPKSWKSFQVETDRTFAVLTILNYMYCLIDAGNAWKQSVEHLLEKYDGIPKEKLGFPDEWNHAPAWNADGIF